MIGREIKLELFKSLSMVKNIMHGVPVLGLPVKAAVSGRFSKRSGFGWSHAARQSDLETKNLRSCMKSTTKKADCTIKQSTSVLHWTMNSNYFQRNSVACNLESTHFSRYPESPASAYSVYAPDPEEVSNEILEKLEQAGRVPSKDKFRRMACNVSRSTQDLFVLFLNKVSSNSDFHFLWCLSLQRSL